MKLWRHPHLHIALVCATLLLALRTPAPADADTPAAAPAPEFTHRRPADWLNSAPLRLADLRGQPVLLDIWTFDCWNCYRSIPWLQSLERKYGPRGLRIVGVHSPEFEREKIPANVAAKVREFGIRYPVMLDNDLSYWRALHNRYWPAFYLVDKQGRLRDVFIGETHRGDTRARAAEARIEALLAE